MQMVVDQVVHMVAVGHARVSAIGAVHVSLVVTAAGMTGSAAFRVRFGDFQHMFIDVVSMHVMHVAVMQVIRVAPMLDRRMPAVRLVLMRMSFVLFTVIHRDFSFWSGNKLVSPYYTLCSSSKVSMRTLRGEKLTPARARGSR